MMKTMNYRINKKSKQNKFFSRHNVSDLFFDDCDFDNWFVTHLARR